KKESLKKEIAILFDEDENKTQEIKDQIDRLEINKQADWKKFCEITEKHPDILSRLALDRSREKFPTLFKITIGFKTSADYILYPLIVAGKNLLKMKVGEEEKFKWEGTKNS